MNKISCCKGCEKRHLGCHSECEVYLIEKAKYDEDVKKIREDNDLKYGYHDRFNGQLSRAKQEAVRRKNRFRGMY